MVQLSLILDQISTPIAIGLFISVFALVALCAKQGRKAPKDCQNQACDPIGAPKSPLASPKKLMKNISNKAITFICNKRGGDEEEGYGEGGLWQRTILMGEKCRPPDFSGEIYYDNQGNQLSEPPPRSPRATSLSNCSVPVANDAKETSSTSNMDMAYSV
ncbi:putative Transmembrane protein [Quillaja saponaria]|uniref:Transmembrane protein n=1 Tax=Quillaja saponaria TaxID=32244 RepID=A0AAD7L9F1_QUISA|nr:putative Transmembrane protein [Quillaja saponaria]